ncbi:low affinity iron permease family protein [Rhodobacter sp. KR11]|uniref:low affinity iron permease family protein n=1 Tax=Rhodobacter sp. KR11 TaxID=2974588 RepID=UPI002221F7B2|nr:low affinity iron permease family protein [Rhodobacter sp. KR11]MCW1918162.1 low affinity iron permease family protein [Rhodobacter sp. KR11]
MTFIHSRFERLAEWISAAMGRPLAFILAFAVVLSWAISGPIFQFSDTWQLVINTGTTISTFLMVFLLQNTGNRTIAELQDHLHRLERQNAEILALLRDTPRLRAA